MSAEKDIQQLEGERLGFVGLSLFAVIFITLLLCSCWDAARCALRLNRARQNK
jgi:hypothetical protein